MPTEERVTPDVAGDPPLAESTMRAITTTGSTLVAAGSVSPAGADTADAAVWTSPDGVAWTPVADDADVFGDSAAAADSPGHQFINDISAGPFGVVAVGADGKALEHDAAVWLSHDGTVWRRVPHEAEVFGGDGAQVMHSVVQLPGLIVIVGESNWQAAVWVSPDGSRWSRAGVTDDTAAAAEPSFMNDVVVTGDGLVAVGRGGIEPHPAVWLSADGLTWDRLLDSMAGEESGFSQTSGRSAMFAVDVGEEGLLAVGARLQRDENSMAGNPGSGGTLVWTSKDGYDWHLVEPGFTDLDDEEESSRYAYLKHGAPVRLEDVAWDGDRLLAIGGYELAFSANSLPAFVTLWVSTDGGATWDVVDELTLDPTDSRRGARAFAQFGDALVIVGNDDVPAGKHPDYGWMTYSQTAAVWLADLGES